MQLEDSESSQKEISKEILNLEQNPKSKFYVGLNEEHLRIVSNSVMVCESENVI